MACEDLKAALTALQAQRTALEQDIADNPPPERAAARKAAQPQLNKLNTEIQTATIALNNCLQAVAPPVPRKVAGAQPQGILAIQYQNPAFGGSTSDPGWGTRIAGGKFPTSQGFEWKQVTDTSSEYDTTPVGVSGWAMFQDTASSDFMFTHPFGLDWEFLCAVDQQYYNLCSYPENLSLADSRDVVGKFSQLGLTAALTVSGTEDVLGSVSKLGFLGVEWENGLVPTGFQAEYNDGDRVAVFGRWIVDVGEDAHTEIHPPLLLASASVYATPSSSGLTLFPKGVQYTRALFTSRPYLSGQTFLAGRYPNDDIYKDGQSDDGHFLEHMLIELGKLDSVFLSGSLEAHPKIKQNPFQGPHIFPVIVRTTQAKPTVSEIGESFVVSFYFTVRNGCAVEVVKNDESSVCVFIILNSVGYTPPPLTARKPLQITVSQMKNDEAYAVLIANGVLDPLAGLSSSSGVQTDQYDPLNNGDFTRLDSPAAAINVPVDSLAALPAGKGITIDNSDSQPYPVTGWLEIGWGGTGTPLAAEGNPTASIATVVDLNGVWASGGVAGPVISVNGNSISVDMSAYNRPTAQGSIVDSSDITVTFPDDKTYTGKLQLPGTIAWSNNSSWTKMPAGTTLLDLNGKWASGSTPGAVISVSGNTISIDMSAYKRPAAQGFIVDGSRIIVAFPDDKAYTGKLQLPNKIAWSNNSFWTKV
jgi:hypothetical protein